MSEFKKVNPKELSGNPFSMFDDGWALLTAGDKNSFNTMTVSWGSLGWIWGKPSCTAYVRESRYTKEFVDKRDCFTLSVFGKGKYRQQLGVLGKKSGRDMDKMHQSGLTPMELEGEMAFEEAEVVLVCRKMYVSHMGPEKMLDNGIVPAHYSGASEGDFHTAYIAEIVAAYTK